MDQKDQKGKEPKQKEKVEVSIIRMAGRDINGSYSIARGLTQIKGIGYNMANAMAKIYKDKYGIEPKTVIGTLSDEQLAQLEEIIKEPSKYNIPKFMLNRNKDSEIGQNIHVVGTDLIVKTRFDVDNGIKLQTWLGSRHQYGHKVRGQRTRSTGRKGAAIGVMKKSAQPATAPAKKEEKK
ncbi:MAG: 30S ribosomal protein S13 [Candidatus Micrarchaeia archaeon]